MYMKEMITLQKLTKGDKVAVLSPSFAAPGKWPHVYQLGLQRLQEVFQLVPVEFPATSKLGASSEERIKDLIDAFINPDIKAIIATLGGDDQITYIKHLPADPFVANPKPFFGFSDNSHVMNFLWPQGIPSYYGGALFTQFAMQKKMDDYTIEYLKHALFDEGEIELLASNVYNDIGLSWNDPKMLDQERFYEPNNGWLWDGTTNTQGITWGGCVESVDEMLRHGAQIPSMDDFENIILLMETSEEIPSSDCVYRVFRALGERGMLERVKGILVGRPKAWEFNNQKTKVEKAEYRKEQREAILRVVRKYNPTAPVVQNLDFGHTDPQIPIPYGSNARIDSEKRKIFVIF
jgi:muramoyltetrapeptide carboxypeptidase LdcA involved in peptidoglycan recycling